MGGSEVRTSWVKLSLASSFCPRSSAWGPELFCLADPVLFNPLFLFQKARIVGPDVGLLGWSDRPIVVDRAELRPTVQRGPPKLNNFLHFLLLPPHSSGTRPCARVSRDLWGDRSRQIDFWLLFCPGLSPHYLFFFQSSFSKHLSLFNVSTITYTPKMSIPHISDGGLKIMDFGNL